MLDVWVDSRLSVEPACRIARRAESPGRMDTMMHSSLFKLALVLLAAFSYSSVDARGRALPTGKFCSSSTGIPGSSLPKNTCFRFDVAYGSDPKQKLDVYTRNPEGQGAPVIVMVHGGGWYQGDKLDTPVVRNKVQYWVPTGAIFVSVNYPLVPQANPLQQAQSVAMALGYVQRHATEWGGNPDKVILMGFSAGGHLVSLLAADPSIATTFGARPWLGTIALDSAIYDVPAVMNNPYHQTLYDNAFGTNPVLWSAASPITQLDARIAPFMAVCTTQESASCPRAQQFVDKAASYGSQASVLPQNLNHGQINEKLGLVSAYTTQVSAFMSALFNGTVR